MLKTMRYTITNLGFMNMYTGLSASLMRQMSYSLVRLGTYEALKRRFIEGASIWLWFPFHGLALHDNPKEPTDQATSVLS